MTEGALFAGIMGFGQGFRRAGFENLWAVEKESFCQAVIRTHFPETELFTDVRDCGKHNLRAVDVLTAGFPCQDLSVAGKRAGLEGSRSGLFWEVVRIVGELRPSWIVLENVPGLFSSGEGRDFAIVLNALDELGYGLAWRVLNSQYFGVAQRRRRVFIVGCLGRPCPEAILFEPESRGGDFAESAEARTLASGEVAASLGGAGRSGGYQPNAEQAAGGHLVATALSSSAGHHGHSSPRGDGSDNLVAACLDGSPYADREAEESRLVTAYHENISGNVTGAGHARALRNGASHSYQFVGSPADSNGVRDFAELPEGLDSARYRALGNAVTANVAYWIAERIKQALLTGE